MTTQMKAQYTAANTQPKVSNIAVIERKAHLEHVKAGVATANKRGMQLGGNT